MKLYRRILITVFLIFLGTLASFQVYSRAMSLNELPVKWTSPDQTGKTETITLTAAGDCLMHMPEVNSGLQADGSYRFDTFFADVADLIREGDYSSTSLETALAGPESGYTGYPMFNSPDEISNTFKQAGFDMVVTANNHSLDRGYSGGIRTLRVLRGAGLDTLGTYRDLTESRSFLIKDIRGVKVGYLGYTYSTNGVPIPSGHPEYVNILEKHKVLSDIKMLRPQVDVLILVLHWGVEYQPMPEQDQTAMARDFLEAGADAILGSHPHVIQTMQALQIEGKTKFVIYGMGNFISNQQELERKCGIVLKLKFKKDYSQHETELIEASYTPTFTHAYNDNGRIHYRVIPIEQTIAKIKQGQDPFMDADDLPLLEAALQSTRSQLGTGFNAQ